MEPDDTLYKRCFFSMVYYMFENHITPKNERFASITDLNFSCINFMDVLINSVYEHDTYTYTLNSMHCTTGKNDEDQFVSFFVLPPKDMIEPDRIIDKSKKSKKTKKKKSIKHNEPVFLCLTCRHYTTHSPTCYEQKKHNYLMRSVRYTQHALENDIGTPIEQISANNWVIIHVVPPGYTCASCRSATFHTHDCSDKAEYECNTCSQVNRHTSTCLQPKAESSLNFLFYEDYPIVYNVLVEKPFTKTKGQLAQRSDPTKNVQFQYIIRNKNNIRDESNITVKMNGLIIEVQCYSSSIVFNKEFVVDTFLNRIAFPYLEHCFQNIEWKTETNHYILEKTCKLYECKLNYNNEINKLRDRSFREQLIDTKNHQYFNALFNVPGLAVLKLERSKTGDIYVELKDSVWCHFYNLTLYTNGKFMLHIITSRVAEIRTAQVNPKKADKTKKTETAQKKDCRTHTFLAQSYTTTIELHRTVKALCVFLLNAMHGIEQPSFERPRRLKRKKDTVEQLYDSIAVPDDQSKTKEDEEDEEEEEDDEEERIEAIRREEEEEALRREKEQNDRVDGSIGHRQAHTRDILFYVSKKDLVEYILSRGGEVLDACLL